MYKIRNKSIALLLIMALLFIIPGCGQKGSAGSSEDVIKLGFLGAKTGPVANYGIPGEKGMKLAIEELNAKGGILGKKVEGIYEDNKGDSAEIASIATKYITRDKVVAMVGDPCTGLTKVAADIAQKNGVVIFSPGATGPGVVEIGDYVFRNTLLDVFAVPAVVDWMMKEKGWTNFAIITSLNNGYSTALTPVFKEAINKKGGKIVLEDSINDGETDFTAQVTKLKRSGADVLVFTGYYTEAALIMNEVKKQNFDITLVGGDGLYGQDLAKLGKDAVEEKVIFYCGFSSDQPSPETEAFLKKYREKYGEEPDMFSAQYYDAVMILAKAMEDAKSTDPKVFKNELAKLKDYLGVSGKTTFLPNREPVKSPVCLITVKDGKFKLLDKIEVNVQ
ncbi:amino acid/amide ABC transporter substrate-binding protein, HAAT family [Thermosyntropha lipolytica DSM 11003]|uniref:Amino acid/amide ABC transporter substrate-binding protein, HAAT family n=1 Tax=Thermosyntropha lipolytica DSM 11003 TaxID=1123382 RepID=A0A1M5LYW4_9FIRM|nr:ABC transporter substrate-binding protein [Thermosyntropha lipolytica]SHG70218.1 amino acid/amide ABC transporter substrate-binding protein, HAAT family [Thermosyntropha lipolytica DSM 11003]